MKPSFEVKMTQEALFEFLMFHTYHGIKGILYLIVGVAGWERSRALRWEKSLLVLDWFLFLQPACLLYR